MTGGLAAEAVALDRAGRGEEARALLDAGAASDPAALHLRGLWQIEGRLLPRDLAAARADFAAAADAGSIPAARIHAGFVAAGVGGSRDWPAALALLDAWAPRDPLAARQRALIAAMDLDAVGEPRADLAQEPLHATPGIIRLPGFFSADECAFLADLALPRMKPAMIFHEGEQRWKVDPVRDSAAAGFPLFAELPAVHALNRRIAAASGTEVAQGETLQVLRYTPGQQYRPHLDAVAGLANQRVLTMLVYLNDDYVGGETHFTAPDLLVRGRLGDGLLFANTLADGRPDPAARHAGAPVISGTKLVASRWIRARVPDDEQGFGQHEAKPPA